MKILLPILLLLNLSIDILSQNIILNELYKLDLIFNQNSEIDSISEVYVPFTKTVISPEFINPSFKKNPSIHTMCNCKNNLIVNCISKPKNGSETISQYIYNSLNKIVEIKLFNELNNTLKFEYDSLNRPINILIEENNNTWLLETAVYKDSLVNISTFDVDGVVLIQKEYPFTLDQRKHIKEIKYQKNNRKVIVYTIDVDNPNREWKMVFNLDDKMNWIKMIRYLMINNRASIVSKTTRKIYYK
ncbi:MAG: hypothetical protein WAT79_05385 [Saprospiraceae bacterium]